MIMEVLVRLLNPLLMIALPLVLGVILAKRLGASWRLFIIGGATFIGSQAAHLPFNGQVLTPALGRVGLIEAQAGAPLVLFAMAFGLSAGVFEEVARYLVYRFWLRDSRSSQEALMFGAGHGGIEAIFLAILAINALFQAIAYRGTDLTGVVAPEQLEIAQAQLDAYWAAPGYLFFLGAAERAIALCFHLSASLLVLQTLTRRSAIWLTLAVGWHTLVDAVAIYTLRMWGAYVTEGIGALLALASLGIVLALYQRGEAKEDTDPTMPQKVAAKVRDEELLSLEETEDRLDDSRYL